MQSASDDSNDYSGDFLSKYYANQLCRGRHAVSLKVNTTYDGNQIEYLYVVSKSDGERSNYAYAEYYIGENRYTSYRNDTGTYNVDHSIRTFYPSAKFTIPMDFLDDNYDSEYSANDRVLKDTVTIDGVSYYAERFADLNPDVRFIFSADGTLLYIVDSRSASRTWTYKVLEVNGTSFDYNWLETPNRYTEYTVSGM